MFGRKDGEMTHRLWRVTCWGPCRADAAWPSTCVGPLCPTSEHGPVCVHSPAAHIRRSHQRLSLILLHAYPTLGMCCIYSYGIKLPEVHKKCLGRGITALPQVGSQMSNAVCTRQPLKSSTRRFLCYLGSCLEDAARLHAKSAVPHDIVRARRGLTQRLKTCTKP